MSKFSFEYSMRFSLDVHTRQGLLFISVGIGCAKRSSLKNWKGREEGEDPGKDVKRK